MKNLLYIGMIAGCMLLSSCSDWLNLLPKNEQVTDDYWKAKEDVEAVIAAGYNYMRPVTSSLINWGELRGASICANTNYEKLKLQNFQLEGRENICDWGSLYTVIGMANSVIEYAPQVQAVDQTYTEGAMNAHLSEAYFMRGLMYFYLVRNFKEVPLVSEAYVDDSAPFSIAKSTEEEIISQIKSDIKTALDAGGAKEFYDNETWNASKGRVTKWALYALMADVCLWSEDYEGCVQYADLLINATAARRPAFMSIPEQWFSIFNPGNSNESIFELNWDHATFGQAAGSPSSYFEIGASAELRYTDAMKTRLIAENSVVLLAGKESVRDELGAYLLVGSNIEEAIACVWKYNGTEVKDGTVVRTTKDANWIFYRMADVMLMKAEALIWKGGQSEWQTAIDLMNQIRRRSNLSDLAPVLAEMDEETMLKLVLDERDMELAAEGKRWYDLVRFGKSKSYKYKSSFITLIQENNATANDSWVRSVLQNNYAWYLPIFEDELVDNRLLVQNPYYGVTSGNNK